MSSKRPNVSRYVDLEATVDHDDEDPSEYESDDGTHPYFR
jgi:hypothetical protein